MGKRWMTRKESESPRTNGRGLTNRSVQEALLREHAHVRAVSLPTAASSPDPMDAAREREDEAVNLAVLQRRPELATVVGEVAHSLATGQYGRCVECGRHIAVARLRAMPLTVRCLACQERFERARWIVAARESRYNVENVQEVAL